MAALDKGRQLTVSVSPHIRDDETTARIMWSVNLALFPAALMGAYFFGPRAVFTLAIAILSAMFFEYLFQSRLNKKVTINDGSAFLTGLLVGMNLPPAVPFYIPIIGSFVAIVITKQLFGGLGFNVFNPAAMGRAFLLISFPKIMTIWKEPTSALLQLDAKTTATPLGILKEEGTARLIEIFGDKINLYAQLFAGHRAGSIGETSTIALLLGALFLFYRGYISWHIPVSF
ncbi:MAG: RnfABCDGE type electron transport complex subunit D, partial [Nitrospirae bacterium]|nr:RnfABCDGE type electron transport complex subunit D [Nitrospirota bacterium]